MRQKFVYLYAEKYECKDLIGKFLQNFVDK